MTDSSSVSDEEIALATNSTTTTTTTPEKAYRWRQPDDASVHSVSPTDVRLLFHQEDSPRPSEEEMSSCHSSFSNRDASLSSSLSFSNSFSNNSSTPNHYPYHPMEDELSMSSIDSYPSATQMDRSLPYSTALPPLGMDEEEEEELLMTIGGTVSTGKTAVRRPPSRFDRDEPRIVSPFAKLPSKLARPSHHPQPPQNDRDTMVHFHDISPASSLREELESAEQSFERVKAIADKTFDMATILGPLQKTQTKRRTSGSRSQSPTLTPALVSPEKFQSDMETKKMPKGKPSTESGRSKSPDNNTEEENMPLIDETTTRVLSDTTTYETPKKAKLVPPIGKPGDSKESGRSTSSQDYETPQKSKASHDTSFATARDTPQKSVVTLKSKASHNTSFATARAMEDTPQKSFATAAMMLEETTTSSQKKTPSKSGRVVLFGDNHNNNNNNNNVPSTTPMGSKSKGGILGGNWMQDTPTKTSTKLIFLQQADAGGYTLMDSSLDTDWSSSRNDGDNDTSQESESIMDHNNHHRSWPSGNNRKPEPSLTKPSIFRSHDLESSREFQQPLLYAQRTTSSEDLIESLVFDHRASPAKPVLDTAQLVFGSTDAQSHSTSTSQATTKKVGRPHRIHEAFVTPEKQQKVPSSRRVVQTEPKIQKKPNSSIILPSKDDLELLRTSKAWPVPRQAFSMDHADNNTDPEIHFVDLQLDLDNLQTMKSQEMIVEPPADDDSVVSEELQDFVEQAAETFNKSIQGDGAAAAVTVKDDLDVMEATKSEEIESEDEGEDEEDIPLDDDSIDSLREELALADRSFDMSTEEEEDVEYCPLEDDSVDALHELTLANRTSEIDIDESDKLEGSHLSKSLKSDPVTVPTASIFPPISSSSSECMKKQHGGKLPFPLCSPDELFVPHNELMPPPCEAISAPLPPLPGKQPDNIEDQEDIALLLTSHAEDPLPLSWCRSEELLISHNELKPPPREAISAPLPSPSPVEEPGNRECQEDIAPLLPSPEEDLDNIEGQEDIRVPLPPSQAQDSRPFPCCWPEELLMSGRELKPPPREAISAPLPSPSPVEEFDSPLLPPLSVEEWGNREGQEDNIGAEPSNWEPFESEAFQSMPDTLPDHESISAEDAAIIDLDFTPPRRNTSRSSLYILDDQIRATCSSGSSSSDDDGICVDCGSPSHKCRCEVKEPKQLERLVPPPAPFLEKIAASCVAPPGSGDKGMLLGEPSPTVIAKEKNALVPEPPGSPPRPPQASSWSDEATPLIDKSASSESKSGKPVRRVKKTKKPKKRVLRALCKRLGRLRKWVMKRLRSSTSKKTYEQCWC